nr:hypothetical protein [Tanacetum cinerariifolium]
MPLNRSSSSPIRLIVLDSVIDVGESDVAVILISGEVIGGIGGIGIVGIVLSALRRSDIENSRSSRIRRFMNYFEKHMDGEAMINSIQNDDHPLPVVSQVSLAGTAPNAIPTLKDPNNETAKDLWDTLERQMCVSEYGEQDRKAVILKCGYKKENCKLNYKFLNNLQPEWKQYDALRYKKKVVVVTSDPLALVTEKTKEINANMVFMAKMKKVLLNSDESSSSAEETVVEVAYYTSKSESEYEYETLEYYDNFTNYGLFVNDNDDQEIFYDAIVSVNENFIENHIDSQKDYDKSKVDHNDSEEKDHLVNNTSHQLVEMNNNVLRLQEKILEKETKISEFEGCVSNKDVKIEKCLERLNDCENKLHKIRQTNQKMHMIMPSKDNLYNGQKGIGFENPSYFVKDLRLSLYDEKVIGLGYTPMFLTDSDEALEIEKFKRARENKIEFAYNYGNLNASYVNEKINFLDDYFQEIINPDFEKNDSSFQKTSSLKPYVPTMILEKIIIDLEYEVVSLLEKEKANLETIESLKLKGFKSSENVISKSENQSENDCQVVEKGCDQVENSKVIAPGMFKLNVSQSVSPISVSKTSCASENVENKKKRKRHKRK